MGEAGATKHGAAWEGGAAARSLRCEADPSRRRWSDTGRFVYGRSPWGDRGDQNRREAWRGRCRQRGWNLVRRPDARGVTRRTPERQVFANSDLSSELRERLLQTHNRPWLGM